MLLPLPRSADETVHLRVLAHAGRELGAQVNERLLRASEMGSDGPGSVTQGPHPPMPTRPCPHRAGPDPKVLLLHVLDVLIDPAVPQHLEMGELTEAARALSSPTVAEGV